MIVFNKLQPFSLKPAFKCLVAIGVVVSLSGCDLAKNQLRHDRENNAEFQETRDAMSSRLPSTEDDDSMAMNGSIPEFQPYVAEPNAQMKSMPLVSISVNQTVPLRDVLYELAQQADYDLELDPRIRGSIIFSARNKPFDTVVERISNIAGLRYKFEDDFLRVELDTQYNKVYKIDYLSYIRSNSGSISNNISVVSGDGADSGSDFAASSTSEADFWGELEVNLEQLITGAQTGALKTTRDPRITATDQNPDVQAVSPAGADGQVTVQAPEAVLRVDSLPTEGLDDPSGQSAQSGEEEEAGSFTINRQAGLINVFATEKAHKEIQDYLKVLKKAVTSQVLIEAKVLEVTLNDQYSTGINWSALDLPGNVTLDLNTTFTGVPSGSSFVANFPGSDFTALVNAASEFGTVRALASPRMTVLNNQSAVLNVATNEVFFEIEVDVTTEDGATQTDVDSEIRNVPVGVLMNVQPSINLEDRTVALALRPTVTAISDEEADPGVAFAVAQAIASFPAGATIPEFPQNLVPELSVQEIDSVIQVNSGQAIVMGGLLSDRMETTEGGVPVAAQVPLVGNLFKKHDDIVNKTELVIFLKATILDTPEDSVHKTDIDLYRQFSSDRRPLRF
ncbi:MAG: type II and III secretion system family protein [Alphaproteobacteria bacterium]|nr:type II and III secretion system family protein [Alphaproteobacteria bacterium]